MTEAVIQLIDKLRQLGHQPHLGRDIISWDGIQLKVYRSLDDPSPLHYEMTWPAASDPSVGIYPTILCDCLIGPDFSYAAFTQRAASFVHQSSPYTETWKNWTIKALTQASNPMLQLTFLHQIQES